MMDLRQDQALKEEASWADFLGAVRGVPPDRLEEPGVVPGWSVKDLVWHNAGWASFAADELQKLIGRPFEDPFERHDDSHWDRLSAEMITESRTKDFAKVMSEAEAVHERVRGVWEALPEIDQERARFFAEETFVHYAEHAVEVNRFASSDAPSQGEG